MFIQKLKFFSRYILDFDKEKHNFFMTFSDYKTEGLGTKTSKFWGEKQNKIESSVKTLPDFFFFPRNIYKSRFSYTFFVYSIRLLLLLLFFCCFRSKPSKLRFEDDSFIKLHMLNQNDKARNRIVSKGIFSRTLTNW